MKDREISGEASKFALLWVHFLPSWTCPRLHNLLRGTSNINKLDQRNITSKITNRPEKQNEWKWFIHVFICSYCWSTPWDERRRLKAGTSPRTCERGPKKMAKGKKSQISEASWSFMQSHSNENGKEVMICNDIACTWDWTQVCHIYPA